MNNTFCPLLIPVMSTALDEALQMSKQYPDCFNNPNLVTVAANVAIGANSNLTAEHLLRTSGVMAAITRFVGIPLTKREQRAWFWAATQHDHLKLTDGLFRSVQSDVLAAADAKELSEADRARQNVWTMTVAPEGGGNAADSLYYMILDESKILNLTEKALLPSHIAAVPQAKRQEHRLFNYRSRSDLLRVIAAGALHHVASTGYPIASRDPKRPWIPSVGDLVYSDDPKEGERDKQFLNDVFTVMQSFKRMNVDAFRNVATESFVGNTAVMVALLTAADVIDATHRRAYQGGRVWQEHQEFMRDLLVNYTDLPLPLVEDVVKWIISLDSVDAYNKAALETGWDVYAPGAIKAHNAKHGHGDVCGVSEIIKKHAPAVPEGHVRYWMDKFVLPHLF